MSFSARTKAKISSSSENWGMGFLLVFFPDENSNSNSTSIVDKHKLFSSSPPSRKPNYNLIISKAQSTISICALLVFITLLLFTLSTFEPTIPSAISRTQLPSSRRFLSENPKSSFNHNSPISSSWITKLWKKDKSHYNTEKKNSQYSIALQGMGILYRRGTRAMNDLVVGHVNDDVTVNDLRLFLRVFFRSGISSRADLVFIFPSQNSSVDFGDVIGEENESFLKLVQRSKSVASFDMTQFVKSDKKEYGEPLWGKRIRSNDSDGGGGENELTRLSYGSVVSFDSTELDPENSLSGFLDHVPMSLRKWACYPMLLGRVRRNFKHVMLVDVKNMVIYGDPLSRVRNRSPESVYLSRKPETQSGKHGKKNSDKTQSHHSLNSAIIMGGTRGIRRLSNTMLTEIVRTTLQHKKKNSVSESGLLSQLAGNDFILKNINLITSTELVLPEVSSLGSVWLNSGLAGYSAIQRGNSNSGDIRSTIMREICSTEVDSSVYRDC